MEVNKAPPVGFDEGRKGSTNNAPLLRRPKPPQKPLPPKARHVSFQTAEPSYSQRKAALKSILESSNRFRALGSIHTDLYRTNLEHMLTEGRVALHESAKLMIHTPEPKGPQFFPPGKVFHANTDNFLPDEIHLGDPEHSFTLNDFQIPPVPSRPPIHVSQGMISQQNYLKLTSWFSKNVPKQENLNTLDLEVDHQVPLGRVPRGQILIELQALVKRVIEESASDDSGLLSSLASSKLAPPTWPAPGPDDILFKSATSRYFCGEARNSSPYDARHQPFISPSEAVILESMMTGGSHLSLKAHFIAELPFITPLIDTLTSINLSYNSFKELPAELLLVQSLVFLSLRNNPLTEIPDDIRYLQKLRFLCLSFCNMFDLPPGLFELQNMVDLDVSYNNLTEISRDLCKLKSLHKLNIEGNRLTGLPVTILPLPITHMILGNNLMHPLLWKENARNQPQSLIDLCCVVVKKCRTALDADNPKSLILDSLLCRSNQMCDECHDRVFGPGLRVIRSIDHSHYRVQNFPFIFTLCSPRCSALLMRKPAKFWLK